MTNWLKDRVQARLDELGVGPVEAAEAVKIERKFIWDIINDRKKSVRVDGAEKLQAALRLPKEAFMYPGWSGDDYGNPGVSEQRTTEYSQMPDDYAQTRSLPTSRQHDGTIEIPEYDIKLSAGGGVLIDHEDIKARWSFARQYVTQELRLNPTMLSMVEVVGNSMEPRLMPSDRIMINHGDTNPTPPGVFALWDGYGLVVKNLQRVHGSDPQRLLLVSENPQYPPYEVLADEITIIGRVVWFSRRM